MLRTIGQNVGNILIYLSCVICEPEPCDSHDEIAFQLTVCLQYTNNTDTNAIWFLQNINIVCCITRFVWNVWLTMYNHTFVACISKLFPSIINKLSVNPYSVTNMKSALIEPGIFYSCITCVTLWRLCKKCICILKHVVVWYYGVMLPIFRRVLCHRFHCLSCHK